MIIFLVIALGGIGMLFFFDTQRTSAPAIIEKSVSIKSAREDIPDGDIVIRMTKNGFDPEEVEIKKGDTVIWVNEDSDYRWPASNLHPTHEIYPEFDPREPLAVGEHWLFTFEKVGEWRFHDHLRPRWRGKVRVEE